MSDGVKIEFRLNTDNWETFTEQLELLFITRDIKDEKKAAHLLVRLDANAYQLIKQLMAPQKAKDMSFDDLLKVMQNHLNPKPSEVMERCKFHKASQGDSESVAEFAVKLRGLALHCNFDKNLDDDALRDQFACGLRSHETRVELFKQKKLTFDLALKEAVAREMATNNANQALDALKSENTSADEVLAIRNGNKKYWIDEKRGLTPKKDYSELRCYCCGKQGHTKPVCKFKDSVCHGCKKKGHLKAVCKNSKDVSSKNRREQCLQGSSEEEAEEDDASTHSDHASTFYCLRDAEHDKVLKNVVNVKAEQKCYRDRDGKPMFVDVTINNIKIRMEVDTGTFVTVLSEKLYRKFFNSYKLVQTDRRLMAYDKNILLPVGKLLNLEVKINNKICLLECFVLAGNGPALIGRQWLAAFDYWPLQLRK
ncbi:uncharacterized protein LOC131675434 [Phymastichus coffea]|uniref:uncharacterized protein LOC131675434 n=1 Tax=Phymastichus coffea TaxID=108790 RepID=UPI00273B1724|nr:uncharacterized protein LOC131675434 [Phymastichus coffea]